MIHCLSCGKDVLCSALRNSCAVAEGEAVIVKHKSINADSLSLKLFYFAHDGNCILCNSLSEFCNLFGAVAVPAETVIAKLYKIFVTEFVCDFCADLYKLVKEIVKFFSVFVKELAVCFKRSATDVSVFAFLIRGKHGKRKLFAVEINYCRAVKLLISRNELVFFLHKRNYLRIKTACRYFVVFEKQLSVMLFELRTEL